MILSRAILAFAAAAVAVGLWWLLPGGRAWRRALGAILALAGFGLLGSQLPAVGDWAAKGLFYAIAAGTIIAAVATISFRSPVYCAIWFGMTLTGTAGLFLLAGSEFLAVATLVVYAGAILVTFLFVLMLSNPEGHTSYDRRSWEAMVSAFTGAVLVGILTMMIGASVARAGKLQAANVVEQSAASQLSSSTGAPPTVEADQTAMPAIGHLGAVLFTRYLVAAEVAGTLLFAALVGAAVIVGQAHAVGSLRGTRPVTTGEGDVVHAS